MAIMVSVAACADENKNASSEADEILKYKNLLDMGVITQDEFGQKKKQIMGF